MRVLILTIWYPNDENPISGTFVHEQADALRAKDVDIRIVQPLPRTPFPLPLLKASYRKLSRIPKQENYLGFQVYHPRYITLPAHFLFENVGEWMYSAIRRKILETHAEWPFDIIHAHTTYPCGYAANMLRDRDLPGVKVVHTIHRTCIVDAPTYNQRCFDRVRASLEGADRDVFVSLEGQDLALKYTQGKCRAKSHYLTNGVNTEKFQLTEADRLEVADMKSRHGDTWNLVFVGYLKEVKGIKELLAAIATLVRNGRKDLRLFLVGRNDLGMYVEDYLRAEGLAQIVTLVGPVLHDRVKIWMSFADAFILPSHSEGLPTVLFEALYAGTPSIFTRVGGVADIVKNEHDALVIEPRSVPQIEEAIARLMDSPDLCARLSKQGHALIRDNYTWAMNADRHLPLYEDLLAE